MNPRRSAWMMMSWRFSRRGFIAPQLHVLPQENMKISIRILLIATLLTCQWATAESQENVKLPYAVLCQIASIDFSDIAGLTKQEIRLTIRSKIPDVKVSDIRLHIDSESGPVHVPLNPDGTFSLPISEELLRENPMIVVNQPRGTMELHGSVILKGSSSAGLPEPVDNRQRYNSIFFLENMRNRLKHIDLDDVPIRDTVSRTVVAVRIIPQRDADAATVVIESETGHIVLPRQRDGAFHLKHDPELAKENPWVLMATNHNWKVETELQKEAEQEAGEYRR